MTNVTKENLNSEVEKKLYQQLSDVLTAHQTNKENTNLVYELFTRSERIMFAKRIAIIALLEKDYSLYSIGMLLSVSESTVARIDLQRNNGKFKSIIKTIKNKEYRHSVLGTIESLLTLGMSANPTGKLNKRIRHDIESWRAGG